MGCCAGNSAAIFEVVADDGRHLGLKCYTTPKDNLAEIYGDRLLKDELYVFTGDDGTWVDVVVSDWIDGCTLGDTVRAAAGAGDSDTLAQLARKFDLLARDMLSRDWAHGDLKPDNIIVAADGSLHLIDFDAVYIPSLRRSRGRELGTAAWQHPSRRVEDYNRHLDDYPIALISTMLHALATDPSVFGRYAEADETPLDARRIADGHCEALNRIERLFAGRCMAVEYRVARLLHSRAYILPQLTEYLSYADFTTGCCGRPEVVVRNGLCGYECDGRMVVPPLFDDTSGVRNGCAEVVLGGVSHTLELNSAHTICQKD